MATKKRLSLIYKTQNFVNTYLGKVTKFQSNNLFRFGVLSHLLGWGWRPLVLKGLITLISRYKTLVSFGSFNQNQNADMEIAFRTDIAQILSITTFYGIIL